MKAERFILRFINLLLSACFAFGVLAFLEQFSHTGWAWYSRSLKCWPILLCFGFGLVGRRLERLRYPLMGMSLVIAAALVLAGFRSYHFLDIVYLVCALILGAVLYLLGLRGEEAFPGKLAVASLLVYLGECVYFLLGDYRTADYLPLTWCGLFAFVLSLYSFNSASLYTGVHNAKGGESMAIPSGIRGKNLLLLTGFLLVTMAIGSLPPVQRALSGLAGWFVHGIGLFIKFLTSISGGGDDTPAPTPTPEPVETLAPQDTIQMAEDGDPTFVMIYGILLAVCAVLFFLLAYGFVKEGGKGGGKLRAWMKNLFKTKEILEYEDDVERTADLKSILKAQNEKTKRWLRKLRTKPERYTDMPDDRRKLRFVYRQLLRSGRIVGWTSSATPNEVGSHLKTQAFIDLTADYNAARYDLETEITPEQEARARAALELLQRRK